MMEPVKDWLWLVSTGGFLMVAAVGWLAGKTRVHRREFDERIDHVAGEIGALAGRVTAVESAMKTIPTKEEMHRLDLKITSMQGDLGVVRGAMEDGKGWFKRIDAALRRIADYLLDAKAAP